MNSFESIWIICIVKDLHGLHDIYKLAYIACYGHKLAYIAFC